MTGPYDVGHVVWAICKFKKNYLRIFGTKKLFCYIKVVIYVTWREMEGAATKRGPIQCQTRCMGHLQFNFFLYNSNFSNRSPFRSSSIVLLLNLFYTFECNLYSSVMVNNKIYICFHSFPCWGNRVGTWYQWNFSKYKGVKYFWGFQGPQQCPTWELRRSRVTTPSFRTSPDYQSVWKRQELWANVIHCQENSESAVLKATAHSNQSIEGPRAIAEKALSRSGQKLWILGLTAGYSPDRIG
jgi:hypothetical protein